MCDVVRPFWSACRVVSLNQGENMSLSTRGLTTLLSDGEPLGSVDVPRPARRWKARVLLPTLIFGSTAGLLAYSARSALLPIAEVWVTPVVAAPRGTASPPTEAAELPTAELGAGHGAMLVQAPGWIEPAPFAISVPALTEGVVREVFALEGDHVELGQVVVQLVDEDAKLNVQVAEAQLEGFKADVAQAEAEVEAAQSRVEEIRDQLARATQLVTTAGGPEGERAQLAIRLRAAEQSAKALQAAVGVAMADVHEQEVICAASRLALSRTTILAPASGIVMSRLVEPGTRISMSGRAATTSSESMSGTVLRIYEPTMLQVRVDVPLADFSKLRIGGTAEVVTEALPDVVLKGKLIRIVHEANIQRNTVPVKVAIENPSEVLKPEMLARVRFYGDAQSTLSTSSIGPVTGDSGGFRLLVPKQALLDQKAELARVWMVKHDARTSGMIASSKEIKTAPSNVPGFVEVLSGLQAGDRVIVDPPAGVQDGNRVRILGEKKIQSLSENET